MDSLKEIYINLIKQMKDSFTNTSNEIGVMTNQMVSKIMIDQSVVAQYNKDIGVMIIPNTKGETID